MEFFGVRNKKRILSIPVFLIFLVLVYIVFVEEEKVELILDNINMLNAVNEDIGVRAFVWEILQSI